MLKLRVGRRSLLLVVALALMTFVLLFFATPKIEALPKHGICTIYYQGYIDGPVVGEDGTHCDGSLNVWGVTSQYYEVYDECETGPPA
jgi:hypothetical protein